MRKALTAFSMAVALAACTGETGPKGTAGETGAAGTPGAPGQDGSQTRFTADGLDIEIEALAVANGTATVTFTLDDTPGAGGKPLDRKGDLTQGAVSLGFALAQLNADGAGGFTSYTTRTIGDATQVVLEELAPERDQNLQVLDAGLGRYRYTFSAPPTGLDPARTQTVLAVATRTVGAHRAVDRATKSVVPAGGAISARAVVDGADCAACHGSLSKHDGRYNAVEQCVLCHTAQASDSQNGESLEFGAVVHRIHRGAGLPMAAVAPYRLTRADGTTRDYSTVGYPRPIAQCDSCHGGAQGDRWQTQPSVAACTSCHDDVVFTEPVVAGEVQHAYGIGPATDCTVCHGATTGTAPIVASHRTPGTDPSHVLALEILPMATVPPGTSPSFTFKVTYDGQPRDILTEPLSTLRATVAGPNQDFATYWTVGLTTNPFVQTTLQGSGATGTLAEVDAAAGIFSYSFPATITIPATATGSFTLGLEGNVFDSAQNVRYAAVSPMRAFAVTDASPQARRDVIDPAKCDACHGALVAHSGTRRDARYCAMCHNPENTNADRVSRFEGTSVLAESVDARVMIHKIHRGAQLSQAYVLGSTPAPTTTNPAGRAIDYGQVRYPRSTAECEACHRPGTWTLPAVAGRIPSLLQELTCSELASDDTDSFCTSPYWTVSETRRLAPETSVCTSCHDAPFTLAHAQLATTSSGVESCATCHGAGKHANVASVHAR